MANNIDRSSLIIIMVCDDVVVESFFNFVYSIIRPVLKIKRKRKRKIILGLGFVFVCNDLKIKRKRKRNYNIKFHV